MLTFVPLENTRSDVALLAGMANTILTTWNNRGNLFLFLNHQVSISFVSPISFHLLILTKLLPDARGLTGHGDCLSLSR